jgi:cysteine desulfurase/selenocysteine lyase
MAVEARPKLDAHKLRADFPIFDREVNGKPLAYLDSAASAQKPRQVLDAIRDFYETSYANVHRGVYKLAEDATAGYEGARAKIASFLNAPSEREVIFTRSATEGINLVAYAWGLDNLGPGDVVVVTELEHHSNFVPWQYVAKRTGAEFRAIPFDDNGELTLESLDEIAASGNVKVVANNLVSNSLGTINPSERLGAWAHEQGAIMVVDAAQAAPHRTVDVQALGADFVAISSHKMCGPTGVGALWGKRELLERMSPFNLGGEMIRSVKLDKTTWNELPYKFEAGTPAIAEAVGFGAAVDYLTEVGLEAIEAHEHELLAYALDKLGELEGVTCYGPPPERRAGIVSFNVDGIHPHDVAQVLDWEGIAIRAGHHCTQPLMTRLGIAATSRASFYLYSVREEIDRLVAGVERVKKVLG